MWFDRIVRIFGHISNYCDFSIKFRIDNPDYSDNEFKRLNWEYLHEKCCEGNPKLYARAQMKKCFTNSFLLTLILLIVNSQEDPPQGSFVWSTRLPLSGTTREKVL